MSTILLVDDDKTILNALSRLLKRKGFGVLCAESGLGALMTLGLASITVVMLDINMPDMSGLEVLRRIRSNPQTQGQTVVMFSALEEDKYKREAMDLGASDYWVKASVGIDQIEQQLNKLCSA